MGDGGKGGVSFLTLFQNDHRFIGEYTQGFEHEVFVSIM